MVGMTLLEFTATGNENIRAVHKTTLEFTKSKDLTPQGDCVLAVNADFDGEKLKQLIQASNKIKISIKAGFISETVEALANKEFNNTDEIVVRMGEFVSVRTAGIRATKAAVHVRRDLVEKLRDPKQKVIVRIERVD